MKVLITGGAGFVGSNLVRYCLEREAEVTVLDSLEETLRATTRHLQPVWSRIRFIQASLLDAEQTARAVAGQDVIFNCAAQSSHPISIRDPLYDARLNCLGTLGLLEAVRLHNPGAVVVYLSSSTVIGKATQDVIDESHGERPLEVYSANKGVAEKYHLIYHTVHGLKTIVLRFANLFGPHGKGFSEFGFINYFIHLARSGGDITIYGDGDQLRNVLYVEDAAEALWTAARTPGLYGDFYFATHHEHHPVRDIAATAVRVMERGTVSHIPWPPERKAIEVDRVQIDGGRFRALTGWAPRHTFEEGMRKTKAAMDSESQ